MKCPFCGFMEDKVIESRATLDDTAIRRRRECLKCGKRYTSYERVEGVELDGGKKGRKARTVQPRKNSFGDREGAGKKTCIDEDSG